MNLLLTLNNTMQFTKIIYKSPNPDSYSISNKMKTNDNNNFLVIR